MSRLTLHPAPRWLLAICMSVLAVLPAATARAEPPTTAGTPVVARVYYHDRADLNRMAAELDVWTVQAKAGYAVILLRPEQLDRLVQGGRRVEIDAELTAQFNTVRGALPGQTAGIPGFPCYRTVEETYLSLAELAAANPDLVTWTDTGDSWEKITPGGVSGYDLFTLVLTNKSITGPKPKFFLMAAIHARELATAELAARFIEKLVADYEVDADTTWLLDHYELHSVFMVNPDGRKKAEAGQLWRKNTDNDDGCTVELVQLGRYFGTDLNRNSSFKWNMGGSDDDACGQTYHGPTPASEPEVQHVENYMAALFGDHRGPGDADPAPLDTEGLMVTLHSYGNSVLYPWGWIDTRVAPNDAQLKTLGRKFGFYNHFGVCQSAACYYIASGGTDDFAYGTLGIPGYTFEVGTAFFELCSAFESDILPRNLPALKYAFKAARLPYQQPAGPEPHAVAVSAPTVTRGTSVTLTAIADDARYDSGGYGIEPSQNVAAGRCTIDTPSWKGGTTYPLSAADGAFDEPAEQLTAAVDTTALAPGMHVLFVEAQDANGQWGVPTAAFLTVDSPCAAPVSPADVAETLSASGTDVTLRWSHLPANDRYEVWRSEKPYVAPGSPGTTKVGDVTLAGSMTLSFTDLAIAGDATVNHYYVVRGANACGAAAAPGALSGEFDFNLVR